VAVGVVKAHGAGEDAHSIATVENITVRKVQEAALEHMALHDPLTGLPNRTLLGDRLRQALLTAQRDRESLSLLIMDIDRFKEINDTLGHPAGDRVLERLGELLRDSLRGSDLAGRMGGDEFAAYLVEADEEAGSRLIARLKDRVDELVAADELPVHCSFSAGLAHFPDEATNGDALFRLADQRLYEAKRASAA